MSCSLDYGDYYKSEQTETKSMRVEEEEEDGKE
jgi:hypothetical protein